MLIWAAGLTAATLTVAAHNLTAPEDDQFPPAFVLVLALWPLWVPVAVIALWAKSQ